MLHYLPSFDVSLNLTMVADGNLKPSLKNLHFDGDPAKYQTWKKGVTIWSKICGIDKSNQGGYLTLCLSGKAYERAIQLDDTSLDGLLKLFEDLYGESKEKQLLSKYEVFDDLRREKNQSIKDYIYSFELQEKELQGLGLKIPDIMLAVKLMKGANLSESEYKMVRLNIGKDIDFKKAEEALLTLKDSSITDVSAEGDGLLKVRPETADTMTFYADQPKCYDCNQCSHSDENVFYYNNQANRKRMSYRNHSHPNFYGNSSNNQRGPSNHQCWGCGGYSHFIRNCPHVPNNLQSNFNDSRYRQEAKRPFDRNQRQSHDRHTHFHRGKAHQNFVAEVCQPDDQCCDLYACDHFPNDQAGQKVDKDDLGDDNGKPIFYQSNVGNETEEVLLVGETINKAVLDSGASETVCGKDWYNCFIDSLDEENRANVEEFSSNTVFKFGAGKLKAMQQAIIPVTLCGKECALNVHIVDSDIPLLLSRKAMKKIGMNIDFSCDQVHIGQEAFDLDTTSSGHYAVPLLNGKYTNYQYATAVAKHVLIASVEDTQKAASRLHRRFAHASSQQIVRLLKNANMYCKEIEEELKKTEASCDFCIKHQRAHPRPKVCLPLAERFNEVVAMDLKMIGDTWVLHCIDYVTRFSAASVIQSRNPEELIDKFFKIWIWVFGPPEKIFSDNEGGFIGEKFASMCAAFNITNKTTAAESPFSNGICERHNALIAHMTSKVQEDVGCSVSTALMWAIHAKNTLINVYGFSPYQLMFGTNPNIPGNSSNKLPAMSEHTCSNAVAEHLNSLKKAREAYLQAENSDRIKRALKGKIYEGTHQKFCVGDIVYYKRLSSKEWQGPGTVLAQDGDQVLVKSGGRSLIKVHPCKLVLKQEAESRLNKSTNSMPINDCAEENNPACGMQLDLDINGPTDLTDQSDSSQNNTQNVVNTQNQDESQSELEDSQNSRGTLDNSVVLTSPVPQPPTKKLKKGDIIYFKTDDSDWKVGTLDQRGGKQTGAHPNYWNLTLHNGNKMGVDLDGVDWMLKDQRDEALQAAMFSRQIQEEIFVLNTDKRDSNENKFNEAKQAEKAKWDKFGVYEEVDRRSYPENDVLSCRWVTGEKFNGNNVEYKARLVVRGFEEKNPPLSDSPTASKSILRICISLCNVFTFKLYSIDVKAAFLQSDKIKRTVLIKPPKEFRKDNATVWKLSKPVYGLNDASKNWYFTVRRKLMGLNCEPLKMDNSIYAYRKEGKLHGIIVVHVDDFLCAGDSVFKNEVLLQLRSAFEIGTYNELDFKYIGWNIEQRDDGIYINQSDYQEKIRPIVICPQRKNQTSHHLSLSEKKQYQELLGKLQWISSQTRPDIRYAVLERSMRTEQAQVQDLIELNKVVKKLHKRKLSIKFPKMQQNDVSKLEIHAFSDAALHNLPGKVSSTHGFIIFLVEGHKYAPLSWASKKIQRVAKQILNAECMAFSLCIDEAMALKEAVFNTLNLSSHENPSDLLPITVFTDSKSLHDNIKSTNQAQDLKLRREVEGIRQNIQLKEIKDCVWVPGSQQLADCLTKSTASPEKLLEILASGDNRSLGMVQHDM